MKKSVFLIFFCILACHSNLFADEIKVAVGLALPPYVLTDTDSGIEMDIVKEALAVKGHTIKPIYVPFARVIKSLQKGKVDAAMTVNESSGITEVFFSDSHVTYQNVAISLKSNNLNISKISDLKSGKIVGFQKATLYLGNEYKETVALNPKYKEMARQDLQTNLLFKKRTDIIVLDINIFKYYRQQLGEKASDEVVIHEIFDKSFYKVGFRSAKLKDDFNAGLKALKSTGKYDKIIAEYVH